MADQHAAVNKVNKFCAQRTSKCKPCGNKYADVVKKNPAMAVAFKMPRLVEKQSGPVTQDISQNAHHILCVAEVVKLIAVDEKLRMAMQNTVWCVNKLDNMIALPLFGHTVYWYCLENKLKKTARAVFKQTSSTWTAAPFQNLPNHDLDHDRYNEEVWEGLSILAAEVTEADHSVTPGDLAAALDEISGDMRSLLVARGKRKGGTHQAWLNACDEIIEDWYLPFSLAQNPSERGFPKMLDSNMSRLEDAIKIVSGR